ncbi:TetR/AcrR family transcriptional regulator [Frankia sp. CNm7]|uniref:TetR/AcrR family transcriptional regulator n=1 Tax=Frankia nepalensis TaxID=1836974 RepID=A0A937RH13_9ACTN|nr:TetR/AcrR family transcriptional regulator [Frankia nepalensis]MBL7495582.1 TetR/AcrR family transcriptional regulator [Frankia nepalensis]MBL7508828.1 TetR/AcrR family transcriptional regulator [Frankia nepalensis]MBL7523955.1 TetR/AcrR family transcriptional regulator [Frankia nepalensis]MBL7630052.1 TetR/AcrR family transcriptional regulator [Frankia nepalensis]
MASRREEILDIARRQFAANGYQAASMRDLAEASGLMAGSLYSHFKSKTEMITDIVVRFYDTLLPRQAAVLEDPTENGAAKVARMIQEVFTVCAAHRLELTILHYDWTALSSIEEVMSRSSRTLDLWTIALRAGVADGSIDPEVDPVPMVRIITSSIHSLLDTKRYGHLPLAPEQESQLLAQLRRALLEGIVASPARPADTPGGARPARPT